MDVVGVVAQCRYSETVKARVKNDVGNVLRIFPSLKVECQQFKYDDGSVEPVLCISNLLPVTVKGCNYHFPVNIYLLRNYPSVAPVCFVRPAANMTIRPTASVNNNGFIQPNAYATWTPSYALTDYVKIISQILGAESPLYSSPQPPQPPPSYPHPPSPLHNSSSQAATTHPSSASSQTIHKALCSKINEQLLRLATASREHVEAKEKLMAHASALSDIRSQILHQTESVTTLSQRMENERTQIESRIAANTEMQSNSKSIDELVAPENILTEQFIQEYAQYEAIEDTLHLLAGSITNVNFESSLKTIRQLSHEQFLHKALMDKIIQVGNSIPFPPSFPPGSMYE
ncbi:tumor susceptibility gene 101 protein [Pelomyxa schiedti]|nr:tumor susceptibility gene 101 protein [Pelomyxa schiedti]